MGGLPRISDAEWDVMSVLWAEHPLSAHQVAERLANQKSWSPQTVKTLLGRLVRKGALGFLTVGRRYLYHPKLSRERCVREESRTFAERVFGGDAHPLLVHMVRETEMSQEEIDELRRILGEKEEEE